MLHEGSSLLHWWHDKSDINLPWQQGQRIMRALMYICFTTDHVGDPPFGDTTGRSVLARSGDAGLILGMPLYDFSRDKFINTSLQLVENSKLPGLPDPDGRGSLMWGSGGYQRSNVYLAYALARISRTDQLFGSSMAAIIPLDCPFYSSQASSASTQSFARGAPIL